MENLRFEFEGGAKPLQPGASYVVVGIVASSNLEVLAERKDLGGGSLGEVHAAKITGLLRRHLILSDISKDLRVQLGHDRGGREAAQSIIEDVLHA